MPPRPGAVAMAMVIMLYSLVMEGLTGLVGPTHAVGATATATAAAEGGGVVGMYRLVFDTAGYFDARGVKGVFSPEVAVCFAISDAAAHCHVPLLLSPFSYSTYRGS